jgi:hypothetical protein
MKTFPNGFTSWIETHHEIVAAITTELSYDSHDNLISEIVKQQGHGGSLYELAEDLTDEFELKHQNREWDGDFYDEIETFLGEKLLKN